MAVNFPQSPQPGDEFLSGGILFVFENNKWVGAVTNNTLNTLVGATGPEGPEGPEGQGVIAGIDTAGTSFFNDITVSGDGTIGGTLGVGGANPEDYNIALRGIVLSRGRTNDSITIDCSNQGGLFFVNGTNNFAGQVLYYHTANDQSMRFLVNGGEKVRFTEDGSIGLGDPSAYGSAGQVLTSNGEGSAVTWSTPGGGGGVAGIDTTALSGFSSVEISSALGVGADAPSDAKVEIVNPQFGNVSTQPVLRVVQNELGEENLIQEWEAKNSNPFRVFSNSGNDYGIGVYGLDNDDSQEQAYSIYNGSGSSGVEFICGTGTFTNDWKKFRITQFGNYDKFGNMRAYPADIRSAEFTPGFYESGRLFRIINATDVNIGYDGSQEGGSFVKIVNESGGNINIVQSPGNTMYLTSDGTTGSRVLANRGLATIYNVAGSTFYIEGGGIT